MVHRHRPASRLHSRHAKRRIMLEQLECRQLLAVDGFQIDLSGGGTVDLFDTDGGASIHELFVNGSPNGGTLGTSNVPGQNNENPVAVADSVVVNEDGPLINILVADLLANDSDPDNSGQMAIASIDDSSTVGQVTLDVNSGTILYDPSGLFESLGVGQSSVDVFSYTLDDGANGRGNAMVTVTINGVNDAPAITGPASTRVDEGGTAAASGTFADIDDGDAIILSASEGSVVGGDDGGWSWSMDTFDGPDQSRDITITATDGSSETASWTFRLNIDNVAPSIELTGAETAVEGAGYALTLGTVTDPGQETITSYIVDWGDGTTESFSDAGVKTHVFPGGPATHVITVSVVDEDGTHTAATKSVVVENAAPQINVDQATVMIDEGFVATNSGTFHDAGTDEVTLSASVGSVMKENDDAWSWTLATQDGPVESQTVTITATDSDGAQFTATFELFVSNVAPALTVDTALVTVDEGSIATNSGTFADVDQDDVTLTASFGTVAQDVNGSWSWTAGITDGPDQSQTVTITAIDEDGGQSTVTFGLVVNNLAPVASDQTIDVIGNVPVTLPLAVLLEGATDVGMDELSVLTLDDSATSGLLSIDEQNQTFRYVPVTGFTGSDSFDFIIVDSDGATHAATTLITVSNTIWFVDNSAASGGDGSLSAPFNSLAPLNVDNNVENGGDPDRPSDVIFVATGMGVYDTSHGEIEHDSGFRMEDNQVLVGQGANALTLESWLDEQHGWILPNGSDPLPSLGGLSPHITNTTGDVITIGNGNLITGVTLDPVASAGIAGEGVDGLVVEFVIIITSGGTNDNEGIRLTTVTGTLTFSSLDIGSETGQTNAGTAIQIDGGTANLSFSDVDIDQQGGSLISIINTFASTLEFDENSELRLGGSTEAAITIADNDGGTVIINNVSNSDPSATVVFNIVGNEGLTTTTPVNDAPSFSLAADEVNVDLLDGTASFSGLFANLVPGPADEVTQAVALSIIGNDHAEMFAAAPEIDANGNLVFTPLAVGSATLTVIATDDGGTANGGVNVSESKTITIHVTEANRPPQLDEIIDPVIDESVLLSFTATASDPNRADTLTFQLTGDVPVGASITSDGEFGWMPTEEQGPGDYTFNIVVSDGDLSDLQSITVTVQESNSAPTLDVIAPAVIDEGDLYTFTASASDSDLPANLLAFSLAGEVPAGATMDSEGRFQWTPTEAQGPGVFQFDIVVSDGDLIDSQTIQIQVNDVPNAPVLGPLPSQTTSEGVEIRFTAVATDSDLPIQILSYSLAGDVPTGAAITPAGEFTWTPDETHGSGQFIFDVVVSDGSLSHSQSVTIDVTESNETPSLASIDAQTVAEHSTLNFQVTATDADLPAQTLTYSLAGTVPTGAAITPTGEFTWTPDETHGSGQFVFDVVVSDGSLTRSQSVTIDVTESNETPVLASIDVQTVAEHSTLSFQVTATDTDLPAQALTYSLAGAVPTGAAITPTGEFTWTPDETHGSGQFVFDVVVSDGSLTHSRSVTIDVTESNGAPVLAPIGNQVVDENSLLSFSVNATDSDLPAQTLVYSLAGNVPAGAMITNTGEFSWTPNESQGPGIYSFDLVVSDGVSSDSETISVLVNDVVLPTIAQVRLEMSEIHVGGETFYASWLEVTELGDSVTPATRIDLMRAGDSSFDRLYTVGAYHEASFDYGTIADMVLAHDGEHQIGIDYDGDGDHEALFTIDVDLSALDAASFPEPPNITSPSGTIETTTPTLVWDAIAGAETLYVSVVQNNDNFDEVWYTEPELHGASTSVTSGLLPTDTDLIASVQANFRRDDLASISSDDGAVSLAFYVNAVSGNPFTISESNPSGAGRIIDGFDGNSGGVPSGWSVPVGEPSGVVEQNSAVNFSTDSLLALTPNQTVDLQNQETTFVAHFDSLTGQSGVALGFYTSFDDTGEDAGIEVFYQAANNLFDIDIWDAGGTAPDYDLNLNVPDSYGGGAFDITLTVSPAGYQIELVGDVNFDSGLLSYPEGHGLTQMGNASHPGIIINMESGTATASLTGVEITSHEVSDTPFAEFEIALEQAIFPDGSTAAFGYLDITLTQDDRWSSEMEIHIQRPGGAFEQQPTGWNSVGLDLEMSDGQTLDDFIASIAGQYVVGVDYDGATDGNSDFDEQFTVILDLAGIDEESFPAIPTIVSPASGAILPAGNRMVTLDWEPVAEIDFYHVGVSGGVSTDVPAEETQQTFEFLPSGQSLLGFVGGSKNHSRTSLAPGDPTVDHVFRMSTYRGVDLSIESELTGISQGGAIGTHAGGSTTLGGLDYEFVGVHHDALLFADYLRPGGWEDVAEIIGGDDRLQQFLATAQWTGEIYQVWDIALIDDTETDVDFVHGDLKLRYDTTLFDQGWSTLTAEQIEAGTYAYQFDEASGTWQALRLLERDMFGDTITVRMQSAGPIILGYHWDGPDVDPDDVEALSMIDFEVYYATLDGETIYGANLDIRTEDERAIEATTIKFKGPLDASYQIISGGWGWETTQYDPADGQSLAEFLDSLSGQYELQYDFGGDGEFEESLLFELRVDGLDFSDFTIAPTVTSPGDGSTLVSANRTPTVTWEEVPEADFMIVDFQAVEPDGIPVEPTIFEAEIDASTTSITSDRLPTGVDFFVPVGAAKLYDDVAIQLGGTDVIDVSFVLAHFTPLSFSIERAESEVPAGNSSGTFGGGSSSVGGVDFSLQGVADAARFRAEYQPIGPNQEIMEMVYGSRVAVEDSYDVFYPGGHYQEGWRIDLVDANGDDVVASGMTLTLQYDPSLMWSHTAETNLQPFQYDESTGSWIKPTVISHDTTAHTFTVQTHLIAPIVLAIEHILAPAVTVSLAKTTNVAWSNELKFITHRDSDEVFSPRVGLETGEVHKTSNGSASQHIDTADALLLETSYGSEGESPGSALWEMDDELLELLANNQ
ncbi:Ig-like domain-containing protein [Stieleria varia]|uniref:Putative Ig domain protein n=1 Tax=Stieleria varia TaxID=2528005 RepID=A0A5C6BA22_9BACT|nr:Ig-like domain-containing protein [Stieleria varia]TWU08482.1 putative Ig domain protein [Stieleria varia]